ncbi:MAG TPA: prephenate dehydratase [archaeon]|nr:prephenate dehydratase [archaeon]
MNKISFLGPKSSFTHEAALIAFPNNELVEKKTIMEVFESVEKKETTFGVVPIENSSGGSVAFTLDELVSGEFFINKEFFLEIKQNLAGNCELEEIKKIYSHPQGFIQCQNWLKNNLKEIELIETTSTSKAAEISSKEKNSAAICSTLAAKEFNLKIIQASINDDKENTTRFVIISKNKNQEKENKKSSIIFGVKNEPGSLFNALEAFKKFKINMTKIESRPSKKKKWEYLFFIDFEGNLEETNIKNAIKEIEKNCVEVILLGSY